APRAVAAADLANADPSLRIRHSRPRAGSHLPPPPQTPPALHAQPRPRPTRRGRGVLATPAAPPPAVALVLMALNGGGAHATVDTHTGQFEYVTVMAGQSLWELALDIDPGADPRDVIYEVLQLNQLTTAQVQPGQRLAIPAAYTGN